MPRAFVHIRKPPYCFFSFQWWQTCTSTRFPLRGIHELLVDVCLFQLCFCHLENPVHHLWTSFPDTHTLESTAWSLIIPCKYQIRTTSCLQSSTQALSTKKKKWNRTHFIAQIGVFRSDGEWARRTVCISSGEKSGAFRSPRWHRAVPYTAMIKQTLVIWQTCLL